jgi:hypothetical protein
MAVLRLDDLVGVFAVVCEVTWSAELSARHGLHQRRFRIWIEEETAIHIRRRSPRRPYSDVR